MNNKYVKSLLLTAVCTAGVLVLAEEESPLQRSVNTTVDAFSVDKQHQEAAANSFIKKGNECFVAGNYKEAARNYAQAVYIFESLKPTSAHFAEEQDKARELIAKSYYYLAQETALKAHEEANYSELENAIALCKEAIAIYPASSEEMNKRIAGYEKMRQGAVRRAAMKDDQVIPDLTDKSYKIAVLLKQAKLLYYTRQYEAARKRYQEVQLLDPISVDAVQGLRAIDVQLKKSGRNRYRLTHKKAAAEAAWEGAMPIVKADGVDVRAELEAAARQDVDTKKKAQVATDETKLLRDKLKNIIIPVVNFTGDAQNAGTPLLVALDWLRMRSKAHDPEGEGVNIFLHYPKQLPVAENAEGMDGMGMGMDPMAPAPAATPAPAADPMMMDPLMNPNNRRNNSGDDEDFEDEEDYEEEEAEPKEDVNKDYPVINMMLQNKSLLEIIDSLAQSAKHDMYAPDGLKFKIEKNAVVLAPKHVSLDDMELKVFMFDDSMVDALGCAPDPDDLKRGLSLRNNIEFPVGSKVMYDAKFRSLIVLNTQENLQKIEDALLDLRKQHPEPMVQVQVKFVEIEQSDLKELGFIQSLDRSGGDNGATRGRLQFDKNENVLYNSGNNTFTFSRDLGSGYNYNLTINAINQLDSKDVLSSPKVLTDSGKPVSIKMTSERYFEWDYEEGEFEISSDEGVTTYSYTPPWPEFEKQELGITMDITPKADVEKRLIRLDVHPWVKTLVGWTEYQYNVSSDEGGDGGNVSTTETMKRPIVAERTTNTNVVIYDNETIVIGGIIKDYTVTVDDKVPVLGDIPLVGNLFKSKSSQVKKTNLLIFVTARMLKPDGSPYFDVDSRGRPSSAGIGDVY